mgnify:CR=1 FL=1
MAYQIVCDVAACGAVIDKSDSGQPTLSGKQHTYCQRCAGYIAAVDVEMQKLISLRSAELANELDALRREKIAQALPAQKGGTGLTPEWRIEVPS